MAAAYLVGGPLYLGFLLAHVLLLVQVGDAGDSYELGRNWLLFALLVHLCHRHRAPTSPDGPSDGIPWPRP